MAITVNTTKSVGRASTALSARCDKTQEQMDALMARAGCKKDSYKSVTTMIPLIPGTKDDVVTVGLNGVTFYFMRGKTVKLPEPLLEILKNTGAV